MNATRQNFLLVVKLASEQFEVSEKKILANVRGSQQVSSAKQAVQHIFKEMSVASDSAIAALFGVSRTNVVHNRKTAEQLMDTDLQFRSRVADIMTRIEGMQLKVTETPCVIIHVSEGLVQGIIAETPVDYIVVDGDVEGSDLEDITAVPPITNGITAQDEMFRKLWRRPATVNPESVTEIKHLVQA